MPTLNTKECCDKCDASWGGGLSMLPRVNACKNVDCPCHKVQEKCKGYSRCLKCGQSFFISHSCKDYSVNSVQVDKGWGEETERNIKLADLIFKWAENKYNPDILKPISDTAENYQAIERFLESELAKAIESERERIREEIKAKKRIMWSEDSAQHIRNIQNNETIEDILLTLDK